MYFCCKSVNQNENIINAEFWVQEKPIFPNRKISSRKTQKIANPQK